MKRLAFLAGILGLFGLIPASNSQIYGPITPDIYIIPSTNLRTPHTGDTNQTILGYINVPANAIDANGCIVLDATLGVTGSAGTWLLQIKIITGTVSGTTSGTGIMSNTISAGQNQRANIAICNENNTSAQVAFVNGPASFSSTSNALATAAINTTSAWTISVNATLNNSGDTIALRHLHATAYRTGS